MAPVACPWMVHVASMAEGRERPVPADTARNTLGVSDNLELSYYQLFDDFPCRQVL